MKQLGQRLGSSLLSYSRLLLLCLVLTATSLTSGCSTLAGSLASGLLSDGPSANANVQAGKTNTQTVGSNTVNEQKIVSPEADTINQDNSSTTIVNTPFELIAVLVLLALFLGSLLDDIVIGWFKRGKK